MSHKRLLKKLILKHKAKKKINIYNKNLNLNLMHTKDLSNLILQTFIKAEGIFNLTDKKLITLDIFCKMLKKKQTKIIKKQNTFSSKKLFRKFPKLKIEKLKDRIGF